MDKFKLLTVANRKGGAGKSTCAAHIAIESVRAGYKTILIDLDPQKTLETWWKKRKEDNPYMADASLSNLEEKLELIKQKGFNICIIDTPGDTSANALAGIKMADLVLIPSKPTSPDLSAIGRTIAMVKECERPFVFLVTQAISRANAALQAASVLSEFGIVAPSTISNRVSYANAMSDGSSAATMDASAEKEMNSLWNFIIAKMFKTEVEKNGKEKI